MIKQLILLICIFVVTSTSFGQGTGLPTDSTTYYQIRISQQMRAARDSVMNSEEFKVNQEGLKRHKRKLYCYKAFTFGLEVAHNDYTGINGQLKDAGLKDLSDVMIRVGFGLSSKSGRLMNDLYFGNIGISNISKQDSGTFSSSLMNFFQYDIGFDLLKSEQFSIYPYAGLSYRLSTIKYESPKVIDPSYTNITEIVVNNQSYHATSRRLGWQAGIAIDMTVSREPTNKTILSLKFGTNRPFKDDTYKIHGLNYTPTGVQANWFVSLACKIAH